MKSINSTRYPISRLLTTSTCMSMQELSFICFKSDAFKQSRQESQSGDPLTVNNVIDEMKCNVHCIRSKN